MPGGAHRLVDPVLAPDREHVAHRAAADVERVLLEDMRDGVDAVAPEVEQREDRRLARPVAEPLVEAGDLITRVAAGRRQEADARHLLAGQRQHEPIERIALIVLGHRETAATHREDLPRIVHVRQPARSVMSPVDRAQAQIAHRKLTLRGAAIGLGTTRRRRMPAAARRRPRPARCR